MADLNIRGVDPKLITQLKQEALSMGMTLRSWVIFRLAIPQKPVVPQRIEREQGMPKIYPAEYVSVPSRAEGVCSECFGRGKHFAGCTKGDRL